MSRGNRKEMQDLICQLEDQGFEVERRSGGHYGVTNPETGKTVFMPHSPSDFRSIHRVHAKLKRIGFKKKSKHDR